LEPQNCWLSRGTLCTIPSTPKFSITTRQPGLIFSILANKTQNSVTTTVKLLTYAQNVSIPVYATTQTSAKLGATVPAIADMLGVSEVHDKTKFSMLIPSIAASLAPGSRVALVGIETHICITQTALDLRDAGHFPYVIADGVSSCNKAEVGIALDRLRSEPGIVVTSSESWMYESLGDASHPLFKGLFNVVKGKLSETSKVLSVLPPSKI
jgi:isochorismate hydrolase